MAINTERPIQDFFTRHKLYAVIITILFQLVVALIFATALHLLHILSVDDPLFWTLVLFVFIIGTGINLVAMTVLIEPLKGISLALSHISGEKLKRKPPNPNTKSYLINGTKPLLELIYSLDGEEDRLPNQKRLLESARIEEGLSRSQVGVIFLDKRGRIVFANSRAPVKLNSKGNKTIAVDFNNGDLLDLQEWLADCQKNSVHAEKIWSRLHTTLPAAQKERIFDVAASYSKGGAIETVLYFIDRTANYANDERDLDFIAFAAHELRGPITIIRGYAEVLNDELSEKLTDDQKILFERLTVSANRLSTYINNILNVSRYDRSHYAVHLSKQSVYQMYDSISDDMESRAASQNRILQTTIDPDLPYVAADPGSISEVFSNLIDNAIKYSNEGGIIEVYSKVAGDFVEVSVKDHGIGMPDGVVRNLFHKFYRSHRSRESIAGSGIGLYISKGIIKSHGGTISVTSSEDRGSTFTFSLPIYSTVEEKLKKSNNSNKSIVSKKKTWISNHNMYRG